MFKLNLQISRIAYQLPLAPKAQHETIGAGVPTCWTSIQSLQGFFADMLATAFYIVVPSEQLLPKKAASDKSCC